MLGKSHVPLPRQWLVQSLPEETRGKSPLWVVPAGEELHGECSAVAEIGNHHEGFRLVHGITRTIIQPLDSNNQRYTPGPFLRYSQKHLRLTQGKEGQAWVVSSHSALLPKKACLAHSSPPHEATHAACEQDATSISKWQNHLTFQFSKPHHALSTIICMMTLTNTLK